MDYWIFLCIVKHFHMHFPTIKTCGLAYKRNRVHFMLLVCGLLAYIELWGLSKSMIESEIWRKL